MLRSILRGAVRAPTFSVAATASRRVQPQWQFVRTYVQKEHDLKLETVTKPRPSNSQVILGPASTPELDRHFATMLHKYILPAYLPKAKRKIIAQESNRQMLTVDPVVIEIDGYEHQFEPLPPAVMPPARHLLIETMRHMKTPSDFENLVRILAGYKRAKILLARGIYEMIINTTGRANATFYVLDALRKVRKTGFRLQTLPTTDCILHNLQSPVIKSGYAERTTRKSLALARMLWELSTTKEHAKPKAGRRLHREPQVVGQLLHLAAARAVYHQGGRDADGLVEQLATVLVAEWPELDEARPPKGLLDVHPFPDNVVPVPKMKMFARLKFNSGNDAYLHACQSRHIAVASYMVHGIDLAKQVLAPELAAQLEPIRLGLQRELEELRENREGMDVARMKDAASPDDKNRLVAARMGWEVYDTLMASEKPLNWGPREGEEDEPEVKDEEFEELREDEKPLPEKEEEGIEATEGEAAEGEKKE